MSELTKKEIKDWLDGVDMDRASLASALAVSKRTVDNWLSSPISIPKKKLQKIAEIMADPDAYTKEPMNHIVIKAFSNEFEGWSRVALSEGLTITEWMTKAIKDAYTADTAFVGLTPLPDPAVDEDIILFEVPFLGAVAAGEPVSAPQNEMLSSRKEYPPGHFVVEINGQSAEPKFKDGSRWVIDGRDKFTPKNGAVCVVSDGEGSYLKVWNARKKVFHSVNPKFNDVIPGNGARLQGYPVEELKP